MTGVEVEAIRQQLGQLLGRRLSQRDLCLMLGLSPDKNAVRGWEEKGPSGPGAVALRLLLHCAQTGQFEAIERATSTSHD